MAGRPGVLQSLASSTGWLLLGAAPGFGHRVAPQGHHPWPWTWGSSSQPFLCRHSLALSAAAPDLRCGVTPLARA